MAGRTHGSVLKTVAGGSGVVGVSGKAKMVYAITIISGATASTATLRNGSNGSATIYIQQTGTINQGVTFNFQEGFFFPSGCYFSDDGNETSVLISYEEYA